MDSMDLLGGQKFGVERLVIRLLLPGIVSLAPFAWLYYMAYRDCPENHIIDLLSRHEGAAGTLFLFLALGAGMVLENIGGLFEAHALTSYVRSKDLNAHPLWEMYLRSSSSSDPAIAHTHMGTLLVRLKFLLALLPGLMIALIGVALLHAGSHLRLACWKCLLLLAGTAVFIVFHVFVCGRLMLAMNANRIRALQSVHRVPLDYHHPALRSQSLPQPVRFAKGCGRCSRCDQFLMNALGTHGEFLLLQRQVVQPLPAGQCQHLIGGGPHWIHRSLIAP